MPTPEEEAAAKAEAEKKAADEKAAADAKAKEEADKKAKEEADKKAAEDAKSKKADVTVKVELPKVEDGKQYSAEEVNKIIQDAVKAGSVNTKNQLYDEIEKLRAKISENEDKSKVSPESEALKNENVELNTKLKILEDEVAKSVKKTQELEQNMKDKDLAVVRSTLIAEANGQIVPEMVTGTTAEELKASAEKAKEKYSEIQKNIRKSLNLPEEPEKDKRTPEEIEADKKIEVKRLDPRDPNAVKAWESEKKALVNKIYEQYGIKT